MIIDKTRDRIRKTKGLMLFIIGFMLITGGIINVSASYVSSSGTETTDGLYTIQTFTSSGTFNTSIGLNVSVLIVGGGGAGGYEIGGGGGGGAVVFNNSYIANGNLNIIVGNGGIPTTSSADRGGNGGNSSFGTLIAWGGGGGGANPSDDVITTSGANGGCGGGASGSFQSSYHLGGLGLQGYNGGNGSGESPYSAGGGGGAGGSGQNRSGTANTGGNGGIGLGSTIYNGTLLYYGCGGGGSVLVEAGGVSGGLAGCGSASAGSHNSFTLNATANMGGGSGGARTQAGYGGKGVIIVRYLTSEAECPENLINTSWNYENSSCMINDSITQTASKTQYDNAFCGITENITFYQYTNFSCNYCDFSPLNATIEDWTDINSCNNLTYTKTQNSTILTYDFNFETCYALTGLESDFLTNITYNLQRTISCSIPFESDTSLFYVDLESKTTILIFAFMFIFVILLGYFRKWLFVGGLLVIMGFTLLFSSFNVILSFIIIASGVIAFFLN